MLEKAQSIHTSDLLRMIQPDEKPTPIDGTPPESCLDCKKAFAPRAVGSKWAELCLECKRVRKHVMEGFPSRYVGIRLKDCVERTGNKAALDHAKKWSSENGDFDLWFYGSPGSGKTYIACAAAADGPIGLARFVNTPEMFFEFQKSVKEHGESEVISKYTGIAKRADVPYSIRLFDDIGAHRISEFGLEMFGLLLEKLYSNRTTGLIFTSNLSPKQILDVMGERISSRLRGLAQPIKVEGSDWRITNQHD